MYPIFLASSAFLPALEKGSCGDSWEDVAEVGEMALFLVQAQEDFSVTGPASREVSPKSNSIFNSPFPELLLLG